MEILITTLTIDKSKVEGYEKNLPEVIKNKIEKYHYAADKHRTILGYTMLGDWLMRQYGLQLKDLKLQYNSYGKPYLEIEKPIYFNISHAKDRVVCAIDEKEIGVDIEKQRHNDDILDIAKRFFHEDEYNFLLKQKSDQEQEKCFYQLWTAKESYIKWVGKGLALPLKSFNVICENQTTMLKSSTENRECFFRYFNIGSGYHIHICSQDKRSLDNIRLDDIRMK